MDKTRAPGQHLNAKGKVPTVPKGIPGSHPPCSHCGEKSYALGLCRIHWQRQRKSGDPGPVERLRFPAPPTCIIDGCGDPSDAKGYCNKHYLRVRNHGDPHHVERAGWLGDQAGYKAIHDRLRRMHDPVSAYPCRRCGQPAEEWAYDHGDPDERTEEGCGPYSTDPNHYMPLCVPCHRKLDHKGWE